MKNVCIYSLTEDSLKVTNPDIDIKLVNLWWNKNYDFLYGYSWLLLLKNRSKINFLLLIVNI